MEVAIVMALTLGIVGLLVHRLRERRSDRRGEETVDSDEPNDAVPGTRLDEVKDTFPVLPEDERMLLTDEDLVIHMLEGNGGQLRQRKIVDETEWSKSKVSRLLSAMEEEARIEKISYGRENVIALPEAVPLEEQPGE